MNGQNYHIYGLINLIINVYFCHFTDYFASFVNLVAMFISSQFK